MNKKRTSILTDLERNYKDTKSISKSVDLSALENDVNPHQIYDRLMKDVDNTPKDTPSEKISVGDIVSINGKNNNNQYEIINISNKDFIVLKNIDTNEVIQKSYNEIKPVMENLDMAKKKINETQYTVSISDLNTTDANALSQMMSAAAQADSSNVNAGGLDMTTTPELPTPETMEEPILAPSFEEPILGDEMGAEMPSEEPSFEDSDLEGEDTEVAGMDELDINEPVNDMSDFDLENEDVNIDDDIDFDEEIDPAEDELEGKDVYDAGHAAEWMERNPHGYYNSEKDYGMDAEADDSEIIESEKPLEEAYNGTYETIKRDYLNGDMSDEEAISALLDCGEATNEEEAIDILNGMDDEGYSEDDSELYSDDKLSRYEDTFGKDDELEEDILLPSETKDETFNAKKKLEDDKDEESEKISESMDALIKSILENSGAKTEQEAYAEEITEDTDNEDDEEITLEDAKDNLAYWKNRLRIVDMGDDYSYSNGRHNSVERQVDYWRKKVEELSMNNKEITEEDEEILDEETKKLISGRGTTSPWTIGHSYNFNANKSDILKSLKNIANKANKLKMSGDSYDEDKRYSFEFDEDNDEIWDEQVEPLLKEAEKGSRNLISIYKNLSKVFKENITNEFVWQSMIHYLGFHEQWKPNWVDEKDWGKLADSCAAAAVLANATNLYAKHASKFSKGSLNETEDDYDDYYMNDYDYDDDYDEEIEEALKNAGVTIKEATVKPTIVTDESTFANKLNKATKPEDEKEPKVKEVSTSEFGAEASEPFHCPSMKCEAVAPKEKIKQIFETAKIRYSKADKADWNKLDRRYITKLIENGCGYQRASRIILEAKKG